MRPEYSHYLNPVQRENPFNLPCMHNVTPRQKIHPILNGGWERAQRNARGGGGVNLSAACVLWVKNTLSHLTSLMISSLYNRENGVKAGHCVATANESNTICPSASALEGDELGCVPCTSVGGCVAVVWLSFKLGLGFFCSKPLVLLTYIPQLLHVADYWIVYWYTFVFLLWRPGRPCFVLSFGD